MQITTATSNIVPTEPMLVPPMRNGSHVTGENKQKRWEGAELVDPLCSLNLHPLLDTSRVPTSSPPLQIYHHHSCVEVTRAPPSKRPGEPLLRPEPSGEVFSEIRVAVLRSSDYPRTQTRFPELGDVVDDDEIRIQVYDPVNAILEKLREVVSGVIQRLLEGLSHGGRDQTTNRLRGKIVNFEFQFLKSRSHQRL